MQHVVQINDDAVRRVVPLAVDDVDLHVRRVQRCQRDRCVRVHVSVDVDVGVAMQGKRGDDHVNEFVLRVLGRAVDPLGQLHWLGAIANVANATHGQRCDRVSDQRHTRHEGSDLKGGGLGN